MLRAATYETSRKGVERFQEGRRSFLYLSETPSEPTGRGRDETDWVAGFGALIPEFEPIRWRIENARSIMVTTATTVD